MRWIHVALPLALALGLGGCKSDPLKDATPFSKDEAVAKLRTVQGLVEARKVEELRAHLTLPPGSAKQDFERYVTRLRGGEDLSVAGIDRLATGEFGPGETMLGSEGRQLVKMLGAPAVEACKVLAQGKSQAVFCWLGSSWRVLRLNKIGDQP